MQTTTENAVHDKLIAYINAVLQAFTGTDSQLQGCVEILLKEKEHDRTAIKFSEISPLESLLNNPSSAIVMSENEIPQAKEWAEAHLQETHKALVQKRYKANALTPTDEHTFTFFSALNRRVRHTRTHVGNENQEPSVTLEI